MKDGAAAAIGVHRPPAVEQLVDVAGYGACNMAEMGAKPYLIHEPNQAVL